MISGIEPTKRRKLTWQDAESMARLIATRKLNEREAALSLEIGETQWQVWKSRHKHSERFESLIAQMRANKIDGLISKIENAGDDYEIELPNGKVITKRGDWRAPAFLLERVVGQDRFSQQVSQQPIQATINISSIHDTLKRIIDVEEVKALTSPISISDSPVSTRVKMPIRNSRDSK